MWLEDPDGVPIVFVEVPQTIPSAATSDPDPSRPAPQGQGRNESHLQIGPTHQRHERALP